MYKLFILISLCFSMVLFAENPYSKINGKDSKLEVSQYFLSVKHSKNISKQDFKKQFSELKLPASIVEIKALSNNSFVIKFNDKITNNLIQEIKKHYQMLPSYSLNQKHWPLVTDDTINIKFKANVPATTKAQLLSEYRLKIQQTDLFHRNTHTVLTQDDPFEVANKLFDTGHFDFSYPNYYIYHVKKFTPNDTYYSEQWHHKSNSAGIYSKEAWDINMGSKSIKIAIIDDGLDLTHPDLSIVIKRDFTQEETQLGRLHGTACAGLAGAKGDNEEGVIGVCPNCSLMSIKLLPESGLVYTSFIAGVIKWASLKGADVISNSWGSETAKHVSEAVKEAIEYASTHGRHGKGSVVVFAIGNSNRRIECYEMASLTQVLSVGASNHEDVKAVYSNYGDCLDVVAPSSSHGVIAYSSERGHVATTDRQGALGYNNNGQCSEYPIADFDTQGNYTKYFGGTSAAAPLVAGMCGLLLSKAPEFTASQIRNIVRNTTDKIGFSTDYQNGYSVDYGYGKVNVKKAMDVLEQLSTCSANPEGEICDNNQDDDCDGFVDDKDADCQAFDPCAEHVCASGSHCVFTESFSEVSGKNTVEITCECDEGYVLEEDTCIEKTACYNVECPLHASCSESNGICYCEAGYENKNGVCLEQEDKKNEGCHYQTGSKNQGNYAYWFLIGALFGWLCFLGFSLKKNNKGSV